MNRERSSGRGRPDVSSSDQIPGDHDQSPPVEVVLATPDQSVRSELRSRLERHGGFVIAAEKTNATQALGATLFHSPHVCLLDIDLAGELEDRIKSMRAERPDTRIGILAHSAEQPGLLRAVLAGADGVLLTSESPEVFTAELYALARGERVAPDGSESDGQRPEIRPEAPQSVRPDPARPAAYGGAPLVLPRQPPDSLLTASLLYVPRFSRHLRRRLQSGMPLSAAWASARDRMLDYR